MTRQKRKKSSNRSFNINEFLYNGTMRAVANLFLRHTGLFVFLIAYLLLLGYKIIFHPTPFYDWDESLYVQTGKEMLENKIYYIPVWQGQLWFDKTPFVSLFYGILDSIRIIPSEILTRLAALFISLINLTLVYFLFLRAVNNRLLSLLSVIAVSFSPLFLQRAQTVNADIFVLLGWAGYALFFQNFVVSFLFLFFAVMSKSLIGFYPIGILFLYHGYRFFRKKIKRKQFIDVIKKMAAQVIILAVWYLGMFMVYGNKFFYAHVIESHFRRVSSSIEFHFGEKTFYIDFMREQYGLLFFLSLIGLLSYVLFLKKNKWDAEKGLYGLYLLPWFLFLNLTKTKIFWYVYPSLPQFAFLSVFPLSLFQKNRIIYYILCLGMVFFILQQAFFKNQLFTTYYSRWEPHHNLALYAKDNCKSLHILLNAETRNSFTTLDKMGLLISTTKWWGSHPSIIYYYGTNVTFYYDTDSMNKRIQSLEKNHCVVVEKGDLILSQTQERYLLLKHFDYLFLFRKN